MRIAYISEGKDVTPFIKTIITAICFLGLSMQASLAYEEISYAEVMAKLEAEHAELHKMAEKIYSYASRNNKEIIEKPLLVKHNKALNGFIDRQNKVSAKFYASGSEGVEAKMIMLFKFNGKKYRVVEMYRRAKPCKKYQVCAPWEKQ